MKITSINALVVGVVAGMLATTVLAAPTTNSELLDTDPANLGTRDDKKEPPPPPPAPEPFQETGVSQHDFAGDESCPLSDTASLGVHGGEGDYQHRTVLGGSWPYPRKCPSSQTYHVTFANIARLQFDGVDSAVRSYDFLGRQIDYKRLSWVQLTTVLQFFHTYGKGFFYSELHKALKPADIDLSDPTDLSDWINFASFDADGNNIVPEERLRNSPAHTMPAFDPSEALAQSPNPAKRFAGNPAEPIVNPNIVQYAPHCYELRCGSNWWCAHVPWLKEGTCGLCAVYMNHLGRYASTHPICFPSMTNTKG